MLFWRASLQVVFKLFFNEVKPKNYIAMKRNLVLIAESNASEAIKAYNEEIHASNWMDEVDQDEIYAAIDSPEFKAYMAILGLDEQEGICRKAV